MKGNLLIAEDDPVLLNLYVKKFSAMGFSIDAVENGKLALESIAKRPPDVLILDIHMPVMDGFSVLRTLPQEQRTFPVIILTNFTDKETQEQGKKLGADAFFVKKDMTIRSLIAMVERFLAERKKS